MEHHWTRFAMPTLLAVAIIAACGDEVTTNQTVDDPFTFSGEIASDTTWESGNTYTLADLTYVTNGATLTIEPGVTVVGDSGSALIITRGASIDAEGTASEPIVFTSSKTAGERRRGDWGGVVLLGSAPINVPSGQIEGIEASDSRGAYGGSQAASSCGTLRYARIEYAGFTLGPDNELNGLTVGACGSGTTLEYIQVHMGDDDGIEFFGGSANLRYAVISLAEDDGLDWDEGWNGNVQFLVVQQEGAVGDNGFECDNLEDDNDATPRSAPTIYNATLVGSNDPDADQRGMNLRRGTASTLRNVIVMGFTKEAIDIRDAATVANAENGDLSINNFLFYQIGEDGESYFSDEPVDGSDDDDDGGFVESDFFTDELFENHFGVDPELADPYNLTAPDFVPAAGSPVGMGFATSPGGFFETADYIGAFEPGASSTWMDGWTAFPAD